MGIAQLHWQNMAGTASFQSQNRTRIDRTLKLLCLNACVINRLILSRSRDTQNSCYYLKKKLPALQARVPKPSVGRSGPGWSPYFNTYRQQFQVGMPVYALIISHFQGPGRWWKRVLTNLLPLGYTGNGTHPTYAYGPISHLGVYLGVPRTSNHLGV